MNSATDPVPGKAAIGRIIALSLAGAFMFAPPSPFAARAATPAGLRSIVERADKTLAQAERAVEGRDPGKVTLILMRVDEFLASFQEASRLEALVKAFDDARTAARASDFAAAAAAVRRASGLMTALSDYVVLRQSAESSRAALRAAETRDFAAFLEALDRFDSSILAPVLLARVREAREAIVRARQSMVHNNMQEGRTRIGEVRRALNGLIFAGALSRVVFALAMGAEVLETDSGIAGRDQLQKALRDLKLAAEVGPDDARPVLEECRTQTLEIWKRAGRATEEDVRRLAELARKLDAIRMKQAHER
jgi:hypothetical protein